MLGLSISQPLQVRVFRIVIDGVRPERLRAITPWEKLLGDALNVHGSVRPDSPIHPVLLLLLGKRLKRKQVAEPKAGLPILADSF